MYARESSPICYNYLVVVSMLKYAVTKVDKVIWQIRCDCQVVILQNSFSLRIGRSSTRRRQYRRQVLTSSMGSEVLDWRVTAYPIRYKSERFISTTFIDKLFLYE